MPHQQRITGLTSPLTKKKIMKKLAYILILSFGIMACNDDQVAVEELQAENAVMAEEVDILRSALSEKKNYVAQVHRELNALLPSVLNSEEEITQEVSTKIAQLATILERYETDIDSLELKLWDYKTENQSIRMDLGQLMAQTEQQESEISSLLNDLEQATFDIVFLEQELASAESEICNLEDRVSMVNEAYNRRLVAIGSAEELEAAGFIERKGLPLFKKTMVSTEQPTTARWESIDASTTRSLALFSKKAEIHTEHPKSSYEMSADENGSLTLLIKDPAAFWLYSRCLVITTK